MEKPSVSIGKPGVDPLEKPAKEMSEAELEAAKKKVLAQMESQVASGNKFALEIPIDWEEFKGTIKLKRPSLDEERQMGLRVGKYLQGVVGVDVRTENLAIFFATFDVCVDWDSAPEWFKPREMFDYTLLEFIYGRFAEWLRSFRRYLPTESQGGGESPAGESEVVGAGPVQSSSNG